MTVTRYHINRRGEAKQCRATVKPCPLGLAPEEHYPTREAAQAAYEASMEGQALASLQKAPRSGEESPGGGTLPIAVAATQEEAAQAFATLPQENVFPGRQSQEEAYREEVEALQAGVEELLASRVTLTYDASEGAILATENLPPGFTVLGVGTHRAAFLHEATGFVYKLPVGTLTASEFEGFTRDEEESFAVVDPELFAQGVPLRYAKTYFFRASSGVPVVVQEHAKGFVPFTFDHWDKPEGQEAGRIFDEYDTELLMAPEHRRKAVGLADFTDENVLFHPETGELLIIDCLEVNDGYWFLAQERLEAQVQEQGSAAVTVTFAPSGPTTEE